MTFSEQVKILLSQARPEHFYRSHGPGFSAPSVHPRSFIGEIGPNTYVAGPGDSSLISEPAQLLERAYAAASPEERREFAGLLLSRLNRQNARVVARSLAATGKLTALRTHHSSDGATDEELWRGLIHAMRFEPELFGESDLQAVEAAGQSRLRVVNAAVVERHRAVQKLPSILSGVHTPPSATATRVRAEVLTDPVVNEARAVISRIRYLRLAKEIREQRNPAIDIDRRELMSRLQAMGFSAKLSQASDEIEARLVLAATDIDVKSAMDLVRTFLEEVVEEASRKIEAKVGKAAPGGPKVNHYGPYLQYLQSAGVVGPEEGELLQKLYNFLSNQGAHKLGAAPEQLRVAHVTVVEWCLLILGRVKTLLA